MRGLRVGGRDRNGFSGLWMPPVVVAKVLSDVAVIELLAEGAEKDVHRLAPICFGLVGDAGSQERRVFRVE